MLRLDISIAVPDCDLSEPGRTIHLRAVARLLSVQRSSMKPDSAKTLGKRIGGALSAAIVLGAVTLGLNGDLSREQLSANR